MLESLYPHLKGGNQKVRLLERDGEIIRLKRGLYVCNPEITGKALSTELIANHLYAPSYVSLSSALRYYGWYLKQYIPRNNDPETFQRFWYSDRKFELFICQEKPFLLVCQVSKQDGYAFVIATPEKALCDLIANSPNVNLRYLKDAEVYLAEDIRMEIEDFKQMNTSIFEKYIEIGKKAESIKTLLRLMKKWKMRFMIICFLHTTCLLNKRSVMLFLK